MTLTEKRVKTADITIIEVMRDKKKEVTWTMSNTMWWEIKASIKSQSSMHVIDLQLGPRLDLIKQYIFYRLTLFTMKLGSEILSAPSQPPRNQQHTFLSSQPNIYLSLITLSINKTYCPWILFFYSITIPGFILIYKCMQHP